MIETLRADLAGKIAALDESLSEDMARIPSLNIKWRARREAFAEILDTLDQFAAIKA